MNQEETERLKALLEQQGFLSLLGEKRFKKLAPLFAVAHYKNGDMIIKKDDQDDCFFFLSRGSARIFAEDDNDNVKEIRIIQKGCHFGEIALVTGGVRTAWVVASEDVEVFKLPREHLESHMMAIPEIADKIMNTARRRLMTY